jgi:hypothetical protein
MRKLLTAYKVAWRWPEVGNDPKGVFFSRYIAYFIPAGFLVMTFLYAYTLAGIWPALIVTAVVGGILALATTYLFYEEHAAVERQEEDTKRVNEFFYARHASPFPLIEYNRNEWVAYGHINPDLFITTVQDVILTATENKEAAEAYDGKIGEVRHLHAHFLNATTDEEVIAVHPAPHDRSFPITHLKL